MNGGRYSESFIDQVRARTSIVALVGKSVQLVRKGREHTGLCPFHKEKTPSFTVNEDKAFYHCFGCGAHGSVFDWMMERCGLTFPQAVEELAIEAGLQPDREGRVKPEPLPPVERPSEDELRAEQAGKIKWARGVWDESQRAVGTIVGTYLRTRGIRLFPPPSLKYHPGLKPHRVDGLHPAMVAAVQDVDGRITGIHRTFLEPNGRGKADIESPKQMAGVCWGGAVRFAPAAKRLAIAEGIESALSVLQSSGLPTWAALSLGNMGLALPRQVEEVILCADADNKDPAKAEELLRKCAAEHNKAGRRVLIARPRDGQDFNDMIRGAA